MKPSVGRIAWLASTGGAQALAPAQVCFIVVSPTWNRLFIG